MSAFTADGYKSNSIRTEGEMKQAFEDDSKATKQIPGAGVAETTLTIASGVITPPGGGPGTFAVDTEAAAANDDLTNIALTNIPDGSEIWIHPANSARSMTVKHNAGGSGTIMLSTGGDFTLGNTTHILKLKRQGTTMVEVGRMPRPGISGYLALTTTASLTEADHGKLVDCNNTFTLSLLAAAKAGLGFLFMARNQGTGIVTLDGNLSETIDGATTLKLYPNQEAMIVCTGTEWKTVSRYANFVPMGHLWGLGLSNNASDATNDIDVAAGQCASLDTVDADRVLLKLSAITKRLDATWAAGTNQGGRSSSLTLTNGTYYVLAIRVNGVDDIGFDTSQNGTNLIADHGATHVRRIGSVLRESGSLIGFIQDGDRVIIVTPTLSIDVTNPGTSAVSRTLRVPTGLNVIAEFQYAAYDPSNANSIAAHFSDLAVPDQAPSTTAAPLASSKAVATSTIAGFNRISVRVNTSGQVRSRMDNSSATSVLKIAVLGWIDTRGRVN